MDMISGISHALIVIIYLGILRRGTKKINMKNIIIEKKALLICLMIIVFSSLILITPISDGIQNSFAKGGLTIASLLILFTIWLGIVKKVNMKTYEKSVRILEKCLLKLV